MYRIHTSVQRAFKFLHNQGGAGEGHPNEAVIQFWESLSDSFLDNLRDLAARKGLAGCFEYWSHTLVEEAADFRMTLDEKNGVFEIEMRHCPSKGRLWEYEHVEPYPYYCEHCDILYRRVLEPLGFEYTIDLSRGHEAACRVIVKRAKPQMCKSANTEVQFSQVTQML